MNATTGKATAQDGSIARLVGSMLTNTSRQSPNSAAGAEASRTSRATPVTFWPSLMRSRAVMGQFSAKLATLLDLGDTLLYARVSLRRSGRTPIWERRSLNLPRRSTVG